MAAPLREKSLNSAPEWVMALAIQSGLAAVPLEPVELALRPK